MGQHKVERWNLGRKICSLLGTRSVFEMQVLVVRAPCVEVEGEERSKASAKVQYHGWMAEEAWTKGKMDRGKLGGPKS